MFFSPDDYTLRWDDAFYAAGVFIAISGVLAWITDLLEGIDDDDEPTKDSCSIQTSNNNNSNSRK